MTYLTFVFYINRIKYNAYLKDNLIGYYFRRGIINIINSIYFILLYLFL
jgi:hypothetical protein